MLTARTASERRERAKKENRSQTTRTTTTNERLRTAHLEEKMIASRCAHRSFQLSVERG
jgi:hypothetical protein